MITTLALGPWAVNVAWDAALLLWAAGTPAVFFLAGAAMAGGGLVLGAAAFVLWCGW